MWSQTFQAEIDSFADTLRRNNPLLEATRAGKVGPHAIATYIATLGYLFRHNIPSVAMAREYALLAGKRELASYYDKKLDEERGHHEWAEQDLTRLGDRFGLRREIRPIDAAERFLRDVRAATADNPTSMLAYIVGAEYVTVALGGEWIELLESRCNIPRASVSAVGKHVELDRDHADEGLELLDTLVRSDEDGRALQFGLRLFTSFLEALTREVAAIAN